MPEKPEKSDKPVPHVLDPTESPLGFFGAELARLRRAAGLSQHELAKLMYVARSLVSLIELAERRPSREFAANADKVLNTDGYFSRLWPMVNRSAYPSWFRAYSDLEAAAIIIRSFEPTVVDGLLQTEDYARVLLSRWHTTEVEKLLAARMERQRLLDSDDPPHLSVLLGEAALRRPVGGAEVMRGQLAHLCELMTRPRILLQVLPTNARAGIDVDGPLSILTFPEGPDIVYLESYGHGELVGTVETVTRCSVSYERACAEALSPEASHELIASLLEEPHSWSTGAGT